jgi:hypothetical protein
MSNKNINKHQIGSWLILAAFIIIGIFIYYYGNKPATPEVAADGKISGNYSTASIMSLDKPYECKFSKSDESSSITGTMHTDGKSFYMDFRIKTSIVEKEFDSFLLVKNKKAYNWTSMQDIGYKSSAARSAVKGSSVAEQAQIIGLRDKLDYTCSPWDNEPTLFEVPTFITFTEV